METQCSLCAVYEYVHLYGENKLQHVSNRRLLRCLLVREISQEWTSHCDTVCVCVCNMSVTPREWTVLMTLWTGNSSSLGFKNINVLSSSIPHEPCGNKEQILHISVPASSYASVWAQWQCTTLRNGISHSILPPQNMSQHSFLFCDEIICFVHTILISLSMQ